MSNNGGARIAKNTVFLYCRMLLSMIVTLYTSRVILNALGAVDYGIYNLVTGFVISFGFLNSAMHASVQRFLTIELKNNNYDRLNKIFSMGVIIHFILALVIVFLVELVGIYFLETKINVPSDRLSASVWIFHFSVVTLFFSIVNVPYKALIIAHEDMGIYAAISLLEVFTKLFIAFIITQVFFDKLIFYGFLLMLVAIIIQVFYRAYCRRKYKEGHFVRFWDRAIFNEMSSFAGWNLIGVFAGISYNQGVNVLLNIFGSPVVNAARAISFQVSGAANQLVTNFQLAVNPPIMKAYATNDESLSRLVISSSKLSFILLMFIVVPFIFETQTILKLWLVKIPEYTISFARLAMIDILVCSLAGPLHILVQATGEVKKYQVVISGILLLNLPISYVLLHFGANYASTFIVSIILSTIALITRFYLLRKSIAISFRSFIKQFLAPISFVALVTVLICLLIQNILIYEMLRLLLTCCISWISIILLSWFFVLDKQEKRLILTIIKRK